QEDVIGFCGHEIVSTLKNEIRLRNIETLAVRKIDYPGAAWLYNAPKALAGSCRLIPARQWLCANVTRTGGSRIDIIDLASRQFVKRLLLPCSHMEWGVTRDGRTLAYGTDNWELKCIDIASEKALWQCRQQGPWRISPDDRLIAVSQKRSTDILQ